MFSGSAYPLHQGNSEAFPEELPWSLPDTDCSYRSDPHQFPEPRQYAAHDQTVQQNPS